MVAISYPAQAPFREPHGPSWLLTLECSPRLASLAKPGSPPPNRPLPPALLPPSSKSPEAPPAAQQDFPQPSSPSAGTPLREGPRHTVGFWRIVLCLLRIVPDFRPKPLVIPPLLFSMSRIRCVAKPVSSIFRTHSDLPCSPPPGHPLPAPTPQLQPLTPTAGPSMDLPASASQVPHPPPGRWLPHQIMSFFCPKTLKWLPISLRVEVKGLLTSCKACVICLYPLFPDLISQYSPPDEHIQATLLTPHQSFQTLSCLRAFAQLSLCLQGSTPDI